MNEHAQSAGSNDSGSDTEQSEPPSPTLTDSQRELLDALVDCHAETPRPIKRATIAARLDCHPVTISVRMQQLRALGLIESVTGPKGGYEPTLKAHDVLAGRTEDPPGNVRVTKNGEHLGGVRVRGLTLTEVHHPRRCRGRLSIDGSVARFARGDAIAVGPMPASALHVEGIVVDTDPADGVIVVEIEAMHAPAEASPAPTDTAVERSSEREGNRGSEHDAEPETLSG